MRKHILSVLSFLTILLLISSCGAQKSSTSASGPSASQWRSGVKGKWVLQSVTRQDIPESFAVKNIFDEAPIECFIGSVWNLPGGNQQGSITFNASGSLCASGAVRTILWSIYDSPNTEPEFQFKKLYAGDKPSNVTSGYRLNLSYADQDKLVMKMPVSLPNGKVGYLMFDFSKTM